MNDSNIARTPIQFFVTAGGTHKRIGNVALLLFTITISGMAVTGVEAESSHAASRMVSVSFPSASMNDGDLGSRNSRKLSFSEQKYLFYHENADEQQDEGSGIGAPLSGSILGETSQAQANTLDSQSSSIETNKHEEPPSSNNSQIYDTQSETIGTGKVQQGPSTQSEATNNQRQPGIDFFDGFEITKQTQPPGFYNGFGITKDTQTPGFYDGFEIDNSVPSPSTGTGATSRTNNMDDVAFQYQKRAQDPSTTDESLLDESNGIPLRDIYIFAGFAVASLVSCVFFWRDAIIVHNRTQKKQEQRIKQAQIDRFKNLYKDLDKYSTHIPDDCTKGDATLIPDVSQPYTPRRLVAIHMGENNSAEHKIEKIDFIQDIEFGDCLHSSNDEDDIPALTMRMVKRNSASKEHWVKYSSYSSDEVTIDSSDEENRVNDHSDDESVHPL